MFNCIDYGAMYDYVSNSLSKALKIPLICGSSYANTMIIEYYSGMLYISCVSFRIISLYICVSLMILLGIPTTKTATTTTTTTTTTTALGNINETCWSCNHETQRQSFNQKSFEVFESWCEQNNIIHLDTETMVAYIQWSAAAGFQVCCCFSI